MEKNINTEIEEASERLEKKQIELERNNKSLTSQITKFTNWAWGFVYTGVILAIISPFYFLCTNTDEGFGLNLLGDFMAGTVASIWALAGLFFIYVAFLGQKQQLINQQLEIMYSQLEIKYTRLELSGQREEMKAQNETLRQQKFENTFFQLITLYNSIVNSIDLRKSGTTEVARTGRDCFETFFGRLKKLVSQELYGRNRFNGNINNATIGQSIEAYSELYSYAKADLSHYFRTIYHILKFIENSDVENKKQYVAFIRAQLSSYEQILLFYNCLHTNGSEKFKPLIERYALFKNIDYSLIINTEHKKEYRERAFGEKPNKKNRSD